MADSDIIAVLDDSIIKTAEAEQVTVSPGSQSVRRASLKDQLEARDYLESRASTGKTAGRIHSAY